MIDIRDTSITKDYVRRSSEDGLLRFAYNGIGRYATTSGYEPWTAQDVVGSLNRLQSKLPFGWIGSYEILTLPIYMAFLDDDGRPMFRIVGERYDGWIALSAAKGDHDLDDLLAHELIHDWSFIVMTADDWTEFFEMTGLTPETDPAKLSDLKYWHRWPGEMVAEHVSHALWNTPMHSMMPLLDAETYDRIRRWALAITPAGNAEFNVVSLKTVIDLTVGSSQAYVNGKSYILDVAPVIVNSRTLVPIRFVAEAFGARVDWFEETQTVRITRHDREITLRIGGTLADVAGVGYTLDVAPTIIDSRTMVPLRFVAEAFGATVDYNDGAIHIEL